MSEKYELPEGWEWKTLGDFQGKRGKTLDPSKTPDIEYELYSIPGYDAGAPEIVPGRKIGSSKQIVEPKSVLVSKLNPRINRVWIIPQGSGAPKIASTEWLQFPHREEIEPKYLAYYLQRDVLRKHMALNVSGVGGSLMRAHSSALTEFPIPLPPLETQHRIVEKIESLFSKLDEGVAELKRAQVQLKRYRQAVLKHAVEGKLTVEWRATHGKDCEPASELLARILAERRAKWETSELEKMHAKGKPPKDDNWKKRYKEPAPPNTSGLPELPEGWVWATVEQLARVGTGGTPLRSNSLFWEGGSIPWVTSGAMNGAFIDEAFEYITELAIAKSNTTIYPPGTLLVAMYGEGKTRGKVSELRISATTNQACAALVTAGLSSAVKDYLKLFLLNNYENIRRKSSGGVQPNLNLSIVSSTVLPLPPLTEQYEILGQVCNSEIYSQVLVASLDTELLRSKALRQSVLGWGFGGRNDAIN